MNLAAKIFITIGTLAASSALFMLFSDSKSFNKKKQISDEDVKDAANKINAKTVTENAKAAKPAIVKNIRSAIKQTNIDIFEGITDQQLLSKLSANELSALLKSIESKKKYKSESAFRKMEPQQYSILINTWSKVTGKTIKS